MDLLLEAVTNLMVEELSLMDFATDVLVLS